MLTYSKSFHLIEDGLYSLSIERNPRELYQPIHYILSIGGKRLRPGMTLMTNSLFSDSIEASMDAALGIEVFHNFTLLHDDIMDNAKMRRNSPTVHIKWNINTAILSGDAMLILAYKLISQTQNDVLPHVLDLFNRTALQVCEGQQLDMNFEKLTSVSENDYLDMIRLKTAVLIAASAAIGGIIAKAPSDDIENLYQFGLNIGIAFQLQDDYLDVFAENEQFGKNIGGDIVSNKKTFLLINALQSNDGESVEQITNWLNRKNFDPDEKIAAVTKIYKKLDIGLKTRALYQKYFSDGLNYLAKVQAVGKRKEPLIQFITSITDRDH